MTEPKLLLIGFVFGAAPFVLAFLWNLLPHARFAQWRYAFKTRRCAHTFYSIMRNGLVEPQPKGKVPARCTRCHSAQWVLPARVLPFKQVPE